MDDFLVILFISQLFDIQYYDGRISIALWILLAGLKASNFLVIFNCSHLPEPNN